jgi:hypothetical protein
MTCLKNVLYIICIIIFLFITYYYYSVIEGFDNINSFDIYDTIIARNTYNPTDIFDIIEKTFPYNNFKKIRIESEKKSPININSIYNEFKKITNETDDVIMKLKEFEIETEINNSYLIIPTYNLVKDGDILISDMYFDKNILKRILKKIGFLKDVKIFSSSIGKSKADGSMYVHVLKKYKINTHYGDNVISDFENAKKNKINAQIIDISLLNKTELFFKNNNYDIFTLFIRRFRLQNPYELNSYNYNLYNDQICVNIPLLIMISHSLNKIMIDENRDTLLCMTRDGCLLEYIFKTLYPKYKCFKYHGSRLVHNNYNREYQEYIKKKYNHKKSIIFDGHGSFLSGRKLYMETFGILPRVHLFSYNKFSETYDGLTYSIITTNHWFELLNIDTIGTMKKIENGKIIRKKTEEYLKDDAIIYKNTVISFCEYYKKNIFLEKNLPSSDIINRFCNEIPTISSVKFSKQFS